MPAGAPPNPLRPGRQRHFQPSVFLQQMAPGLGLAATLLGFLGGVAWQLQQAEAGRVPAGAWAFALALWGASAWGLRASFLTAGGRRSAGPTLALAMISISSATFGAAWADCLAVQRLAEALPASLEGVDLELTGTIDELPAVSSEGTRFVFEVEAVQRPGAATGALTGTGADTSPEALTGFPRRVWLGWWTGWSEDGLTASTVPALRAGQRWVLPVRLKAPHGLFNPHGFDAELWLFERGLRATGSVRTGEGAVPRRLLDAPAWHRPFESARQAIATRLIQQVPQERMAGILAALVVGDQAAIERLDWAVFRDSGVAHLMSISGLHVTLFAWIAGGVIGWAWRRWPRGMLSLPAPIAARLGGLLAAAAYAALAGWGVPAQRTVWMLAVATLVPLLGLRWPPLLLLAAAAAVVVLLDPWALLQVGFWLSFAAVALLLLAERPRPEPTGSEAPANVTADARPGWGARLLASAREGLRTQVVASVGLTPLTLICFQQVSIVGFVANLVAIPLITGVITPLALLGVVVPGLWTVAAALLEPFMQALEALARLPLAVGTVSAPPGPAWVLALLGSVLLMGAWAKSTPAPSDAGNVSQPRRWSGRRWALVAGSALLLPLFLWPAPRPEPGRLRLIAVDVGQGTAVIVQTHRHVLLVDTGPAFGRSGDAGERVLLPLLRAMGHRHLDHLLLSHRDTDHIGGAASILAALPVETLSASIEPGHRLLARARSLGVAVQPCGAGQSWTWDGVRFEGLHPADAAGSGVLEDRGADATYPTRAAKPQKAEKAEPTPNARSCVLRVTDAAGRAALLTGDIGAAEEAALLARGALAPAEVLIVPHHGSRSSSSEALLAAVQPQIAVMQLGYRNRYGHPAPTVLQRYADSGVAVHRSDHCGAWQWDGELSGCERERRRRYWHWQPLSGTSSTVASR